MHSRVVLPEPGLENQVQRKDAFLRELLPVRLGIGIVLGQYVLFDLHHALAIHPRRVGVRRLAVRMLVHMRVFMRVFMRFVAMFMAMAVPAAISMHMVMAMFMVVVGGLALDSDFADTAAASCAHSISPLRYSLRETKIADIPL